MKSATSIFISYRRDDSSGSTGRLYDHLARAFGRANVFIDIDSIDAGAEVESKIAHTLNTCDLILVVIGSKWLTVKAPDGDSRLSQAGDYVRREIEMALERGKNVVPILVEGAQFPDVAMLPESLAPLARLNAKVVSHHSFSRDVAALIGSLRGNSLAPTVLIEAGTDVKSTRFNFRNFFSEGEEFLLTGTNFGDQMGDRGTPPNLLHQLVVKTLKRSAQTSVYLIIAPFELLEKMIPNSIADLRSRSAARLSMLQNDPRLTRQEKARLHIFDHRGATFLSVALRDPNESSRRRGLAIVTARWFTDQAGPQRMFFALDEETAPEAFRAFILPIYPSIKVEESSFALQADRTLGGRNIEQICSALNIAEDPFMTDLAAHPI